MSDYRVDPAAFAREALQVDVLPWQAAILTRLTGQAAAEGILTRRAERCRAAGEHYRGGLNVAGACRACGTRKK